MNRFLTIVLTCMISVLLSSTARITRAEPEKTPALVMQEHVKKMEKTRPEQYKQMVKSSNGNVSECLGCHKKAEDKKSHFHFQHPVSQLEKNR
jgi:hypothetical protein